MRSTTRVTDPADEHEHLQLQHRRRRVRVPGFWPAVLGGIIAIAAGVYCLDHHHLHGTNLIVISGCLFILATIRFEAWRNRNNARKCLEVNALCARCHGA